MPPLYHLSFSDLREGGIACQHLQLPRKRALRASPNVFPTNHHYKLTAHRKRQNEDTRNFAKLDMRCSELTFTMKKQRALSQLSVRSSLHGQLLANNLFLAVVPSLDGCTIASKAKCSSACTACELRPSRKSQEEGGQKIGLGGRERFLLFSMLRNDLV